MLLSRLDLRSAIAIFFLIFLFPIAAMAIDTDGDGVDDSLDAFPSKPEATTDTDLDGKPNTIDMAKLTLIASDDFETGNFFSLNWMNYGSPPWTVQSTYTISGSYSARATNTGSSSTLQINRSVIGTEKIVFNITATGNAYCKTNVYDGGSGIALTYTNITNGTGSIALNAGNKTARWELKSTGASGCTAIIDNVRIYSTSLIEDTDDDNDGTADIFDAFPLNPAEWADSDSDSIGNNSDNCPNNSNVNQLNNDGDSQGDACDSDDDNDSIGDNFDAFPLNPTEWADSDSDSIGNNSDNCPNNSNVNQLNNDGDSQGDTCDSDDDNDGVTDISDAFPFNNAESVDTDSDGLGNNADLDDDADGIPDNVDEDPVNPINKNLLFNGTYVGSSVHEHALLQ